MPIYVQNADNKALPNWVPTDVQNYLLHTETGLAIRYLARQKGCHASTVMRQIRRLEHLRDDPLVDDALRKLGKRYFQRSAISFKKEAKTMMTPSARTLKCQDDRTLRAHAIRVLPRLCETGAILAVADGMDQAIVVRSMPDGSSSKTAVLDTAFAQAFALKAWITCREQGRVSRYRITNAGRNALKDFLEQQDTALSCSGFAEAQVPFTGKQTGFETSPKTREGTPKRVRYAASESPLLGLARRRDRDGKPFLSDELVTAGERMREDFELAQMGARVGQNWNGFLTAGITGASPSGNATGTGPSAARQRVEKALTSLGAGLGDVVLRCCCHLEGLESAERRMGWSARSGKIVLRIALQRLSHHYQQECGKYGPLIG